MGVKFCLENLEFPCGCHQRLPPRRVPKQPAPVLLPAGVVCVYMFLIKQQPFVGGLSEEKLAAEAAHTDSGLRISGCYMISVNTRAASSLKTSSAYALLLCVGGWMFFLSPPRHALQNSVFPLRLRMFFQAQTQLPPSWGCFLWHLCPESFLGTGTRWGANTPALQNVLGKSRGFTQPGQGGGQDTACGCCLFASVPDLAHEDRRASAGLAVAQKHLSWTSAARRAPRNPSCSSPSRTFLGSQTPSWSFINQVMMGSGCWFTEQR